MAICATALSGLGTAEATPLLPNPDAEVSVELAKGGRMKVLTWFRMEGDVFQVAAIVTVLVGAMTVLAILSWRARALGPNVGTGSLALTNGSRSTTGG